MAVNTETGVRPSMTGLCEHDADNYTTETGQTPHLIIIHTWCGRCGAIRTERRQPQTTAEHFRCRSQALLEVVSTAVAEARRILRGGR